ncbi:hypothetical protein PR202_ga24709 [Eleusine coracana subsp. coracana]|uniref:Uncharacterized protein n=1 Tax=Eleusine coracana subsp. coracana TaxID=191504 RepID=A0AAV5D8M3_ELECO|nr:hypothetical protein PR202_ga24709 [Eleusine coracana subsp. coracana]
MVPMHVAEDQVAEFISVLGCRREGFPQTYLGLPLSSEKLHLSAFAPLICKFDKHLSGWEASLLNPNARTVLVNTVLDSLPTYAMMVLELPPGVLAAIDSLFGAYIWSGEENTSGATCMVAWDRVATPKHCGGLGVRDLRAQNQCLLLKLLHRLNSIGDSSWVAWVHEHADIPTMEDDLAGQHWGMLGELLPMYQDLSIVEIAEEELGQLKVALQQTQLTTAPDTRRSPLIALDNKLRTAPIYQMMVASAP